MTHTFNPRTELTLTLEDGSKCVEITQSNYPDEDVSIYINNERIIGVIDFLRDALARLEKEDAE